MKDVELGAESHIQKKWLLQCFVIRVNQPRGFKAIVAVLKGFTMLRINTHHLDSLWWNGLRMRNGERVSPPTQKMPGLAFKNPHESKRSGSLTQTYCGVVIKMTLKVHMCVCAGLKPPPISHNTHTHTHSPTDASDHYGLQFRQTFRFGQVFLPLADNCTKGDLFILYFFCFNVGKGSDKLHSVLKMSA